MRFKLLFAALLFSFGLNAQIYEPVKWEMSSKQISANEYDLIFQANMEDGWTIYSQFTDDNGPVPTYFEFDAGDHYTTKGDVAEKGKKKEGPDPLFDNVTVIKYIKSPVIFTQRITATDASKPITGYLEFMTCDAERCLPPTSVDFSFDLNKAEKTVAEVKEDDNDASKTIEASANTGNDRGQGITGQSQTDESTTTSNDTESEPIPTEASKEGMIDPVKWSFAHKKLSDEEYELSFTADLLEGWTLPSLFSSQDDGPLPTFFYFDEGEHYSNAGDLTEEGKKKEGPDPLFNNAIVIKFIEGPVVFKQKVKVTDINTPITGEIEYTSCDHEKCLTPQLAPFSFSLNGAETIAAGPNLQGDGIDQTRAPIRETYVTPIGDCGKEEVARGNGLVWTFILGFLGGLVALLTPCVFPMIPLTVSFFTKGGQDKTGGIRDAIIYGISIIVIYVAIGLIITAAFGPTALNLLSTNWIANTLFFLIFVFFAFSFFGYYEITLPSSWANKSNDMADKGTEPLV